MTPPKIRYHTPRLITLLALLPLLLSACGWQLRGSTDTQLSMRLHLQPGKAKAEMVSALSRSLGRYGIELVDTAGAADYVLNIIDARSEQRTATVSGSARVSERLLNEQLTYQVNDRYGNQVVSATTVGQERIFEYKEDNVLATADEANTLRKEMHYDLARQIVTRLAQLGAPALQ